jgi:hypothetical protein
MEAPIDAPMKASLKASLMTSLENPNMLSKYVEHLDIKHNMKGFVFTGSSWTKSDQRIKDDNLQADNLQADNLQADNLQADNLQADKLRVNTFVRDESVRLSNYRDNGIHRNILVSWCDFWTMKKILASTKNPLSSNDEYAKAQCRFFTLNGFH